MARIAISKRDALKVSDIEIQRAGPSYTVDTLRELHTLHGDRTDLFFLVGADAFFEIHTWKSYPQMFDLAAFIVMTRPDLKKHPASLQSLVLDYTHLQISDRYALSEEGSVLEHPEKKSINLASVTPLAIASTQIRDMIRIGQPIHQCVGSGVSDYIVNKGLYR